MNIAMVNTYGDIYYKDKLFDSKACKIGQNLLLPGIMLKREMERLGHTLHTADMFDINDIDVFIFQDLNKNSILLLNSLTDYLKYFLKRKWKYDYLKKSLASNKSVKKILIMQEPPTVCPQSYETKYHRFFDEILTWDDEKIVQEKYHKFQYPQVPAVIEYKIPFCGKKLCTMIAGNKKSNSKNELYSKRYETILFFEEKRYDFDLYGFGWENENLNSYCGPVDDKLRVLSRYKYAICYENMCGIKGYITEKIFDCFFANVVPIYWGADNVTDYIPENTFIDRRKYKSLNELYEFINSITEEQYLQYLDAIKEFINSESFKNSFSIDAYVNRMVKAITGRDD